MRISEEKIRYLGEKLAGWLQDRPDVALKTGRSPLVLALSGAIRRGFEVEAELDREVDRILSRYRSQIGAQNMDPELLREKIRKQLARERGIVL